MDRRFGILGVFALSLSVAGCSAASDTISSSESSLASPSESLVGAASQTSALTSDPSLEDGYVGTYASFARTVRSGRAPIVGNVRAVSTVLARVELKKTAAGLQLVEQGCRIINESNGASVTVADAVARSTAPIESAVTIARDGNDLRFERAEFVSIVGARLTNPDSDALPTTASDARVFDQDGDGKPGITASVRGNAFIKGDVYVVQRIRGSASGTIDGSGVFRGKSKSDTEQIIIDASSAILKTSLTLTPEENAPENLALMVPTPTALSCDDIVMQRQTLFGQ